LVLSYAVSEFKALGIFAAILVAICVFALAYDARLEASRTPQQKQAREQAASERQARRDEQARIKRYHEAQREAQERAQMNALLAPPPPQIIYVPVPQGPLSCTHLNTGGGVTFSRCD
jgi:hypothetical protein